MGAYKELTADHLEAFINRDLEMVKNIAYLEPTLDRNRPVKEEVEMMRNISSSLADKKGNRLASNYLNSSPESFKFEKSFLSENRSFTSGLRNAFSTKSARKQDPLWNDSKGADAWVNLETRPLSSMVHLNKISTKKSPNFEDYPLFPKYIESKEICTKGLLGDGYQVSRPVTIDARKYELLNMQTVAQANEEEEAREKQYRKLVSQNSTTEWMQEYSSKGRKTKEDEEKRKSFKDKDFEDLERKNHNRQESADKTVSFSIQRKTSRDRGSEEGKPSVQFTSFNETMRFDNSTLRETRGKEAPIAISEYPIQGDNRSYQRAEAKARYSRGSDRLGNNPINNSIEEEPSRDPEASTERVNQNKNKSFEKSYNYFELWKEKHGYSHNPDKTFESKYNPQAFTGYDSEGKTGALGIPLGRLIGLKNEIGTIASDLVVNMPSNLFNLYEVIKRREDSNFFTKRDLQLLLAKLGLDCLVMISDVVYELMDFGKDGVVCFSDFERAILPRDPNILSVASKAPSQKFVTLDQFGAKTGAKITQLFSKLIEMAEMIYIIRRDNWREIKELAKLSELEKAKTERAVFHGPAKTGDEDEVFIKRALLADL